MSNHETRLLFCDLKTDEEKAKFFLSGRGYETGVIALSIQNDVAMTYHRCSEYRKEVEALQAEIERLLDALRQIEEWPDGGNLYGQEKIKRFARAALDAAIRGRLG